MKLLIKTIITFLLTLFLILLYCPEANSQIIADHLAVQEFDLIPDEWIEAAKALTVHYGHTSHGSQILAGLYWIEEYIDPVKYKISIGPRNESRTPDLPPQTDPISLRMWEEGLWPETTGDRLGYWLGDAAVQGTEAVLNSGLFDISGWSWCGEVALNDWPYIQDYLDTLSGYELNFPDVKIFYMTGHNVAPGPPNHQQLEWERLHNNNQGIKDHCIETNSILFDFADIETHDPDGNYYPDEDGTGTWCEAWLEDHLDEYPNLPPQEESGGGVGIDHSAHAHGLFTVMKAKAFWWMMARIAGWPGLRKAFLSYEETVNAPASYSFNESDENGDGHQVDIEIKSLSGSGSIIVEQINFAPPGAPGLNVCEHFWDISHDPGIDNFSSDIIFHYSDADVAGYNESEAYLGIAKFDSVNNTWTWLGGSVETGNNTITVTGITTFSRFALYRRIFGDITGDGYVNAADLQRLGDCWQEMISGEFSPDTDMRFFNYNKENDNYNQIIDSKDLQVFQGCWHDGIKP